MDRRRIHALNFRSTTRTLRCHRVAARGALLLAVTVAGSVPASAIDGLNRNNIASDTHSFVGRTRNELNAICTGSLIRPNPQAPATVLTAAHCLNDTGVRENDQTRSYSRQHFESFEVAGSSYVGLGVGHRNFAYQAEGTVYNSGLDDIGLILLLDGPNPANVGVIAAGNQNTAANDEVKIVGYSRVADDQAAAHIATAKVSGVAGNNIDFAVPPSENWTGPGDSGGPSFQTFVVNGQNVERIVGVHNGGLVTRTPDPAHQNDPNFGVGAGSFFQARANQYIPFISGDGSGGNLGRVNRLDSTGATNWNNAARWRAGSGNAQSAPADDEVAVLDPTDDANQRDMANTTVTINATTAQLEGLLNDVKLEVRNNASLRVRGRTGALNGGLIDIGPDNSNARLTIASSLHNVGTVKIGPQATATLGGGSPLAENQTEIVLYNSGSDALFDVAGGSLRATYNDPAKTALVVNDPNATFRAAGQLNNFSSVTMDAFTNLGTTQFNAGSDVRVARAMNNTTGAEMTITGFAGIMASTRVEAGWFDNGFAAPAAAPGAGKVFIGDDAQLVINPTRFTPFNVFHFFNNRTAGEVNVLPGGELVSYGHARNDGDLGIIAGAMRGATARFETTAPPFSVLASGGRIEFSEMFPGVEATLHLVSESFLNEGILKGKGHILLTGESHVTQKTVGARVMQNNWNDIRVTWSQASAGGFPVGFEAASEDNGAVFAGLAQPYAMERMCITDNSFVALFDRETNEDPIGLDEVIYVEAFGIASNSFLDLNGVTIYYGFIDPTCFDGTGMLLNAMDADGTLRFVQIPEPASATILLAGLALIGLRRRVV